MRSTSPSSRSVCARSPCKRNRQREIAIGHAFGFEFNQRVPQAAGFHVGRAVHHRGRRAFRLLYVGHHRIAFGKVVALRAADLAPRRVQIPRAPFERHGHHAVEPVQVVQEVGGRPGRRGQERVENHGLAVQSKMPAFGFQLGVGQSPVQAAAGRPVPRRTAGLVHQLGEEAGAFVCRQDVERRQIGDQRTAGIDLLPKAPGRVLDLLAEVDRFVGSPPPRHPRLHVVLPPRLMVAAVRRRREARVVAPRDKGVDLLDARSEERAPLPLPEVGDRRQAGIGVGEDRRPAEQVEIEPRAGVDA